jgi:hypothetical protein
MEMRGKTGRYRGRIVLDGRPGDWFAGTRNAPVRCNSAQTVVVSLRAIDGDGRARWYVDGVRSVFNEALSLTLARFRGISVLEPPLPARFSPDGQRFACFADVVEKGVAIIEDDVPGRSSELRAPVFAPTRDTSRTSGGHTARRWPRDRRRVSSEWDATGTGEPVFSPDSRRVAVTLERATGGLLQRKLYAVAVDGRSSPENPATTHRSPRIQPRWNAGRLVATTRDRSLHRHRRRCRTEYGRGRSDFRFDGVGRVVYAGRTGSLRQSWSTGVVDRLPTPSCLW